MSSPLRVVQAASVAARTHDTPLWLVDELWGEGAVGVIGGQPKCGKTWLALELAVAVASGQPCLGRFHVPRAGVVLVYAAEDPPEQIRERLQQLAQARQANFHTLDVRLILEPALRLDRPEYLHRLRLTLEQHQPRLLILDPYVRLQRADENDATQVSSILAALRELSRAFRVAIALVHHARKNASDHPGQSLRGSSDFHAWGDSNLYLHRRRNLLLLTREHRFAPAGPTLALALSGQTPVRLQLVQENRAVETPLAQRILDELAARPQSQLQLRTLLRVRNQNLGETLRKLEAQRQITRRQDRWALAP